MFSKAGEMLFDDYWANFGKMVVPTEDGKYKKLSSFYKYLNYRGLPIDFYNPKASRRKPKTKVKAKEKRMLIDKVYIPPIKTQGIKTKLVPLIKRNVCLTGKSVWIEPFMGSGVVGFNVAPHDAVFADINPHIIAFYNRIKEGGNHFPACQRVP